MLAGHKTHVYGRWEERGWGGNGKLLAGMYVRLTRHRTLKFGRVFLAEPSRGCPVAMGERGLLPDLDRGSFGMVVDFILILHLL